MDSKQMVGLAMVCAGVGDVVAITVLRGRLPESKLRLVIPALGSSAAVLTGLGAALLAGWL